MKTSLILFVVATLAPILIFAGLGVAATFSIASIVGISALLSHDYGHQPTYRLAPVKVRQTGRSEHHPLAA